MNFHHWLHSRIFILIYCRKLKYLIVKATNLPLRLPHIDKLQQIYIQAFGIDVPDDFMTTVSAHGGLAHVAMEVRSLTADGIRTLVSNSPNLTTLYLFALRINGEKKVNYFNHILKRQFQNRELFTSGYCNINGDYFPSNLLGVLQQ